MTSFYQYLPIDDALFHDGFYVTGAGRTIIPPGVAYPPKPHPTLYHFTWAEGRIFPEFALILITEGKGIFESREMGRQEIQAGHILLLFPGIWHRYRPDAHLGWTEKWIQFNGEFVHKLWDREILSTDRQLLRPTHFARLEQTMEFVLNQIEKRPGFNSLRYALHVAHLLDLVADSPWPKAAVSADPPGTPSPMLELVRSAQNYIWTHSQHALTVVDVASHLGVSRRTLERRFQAGASCTIAQEIARCRFHRAQRLLRETDLPVKKIVYLSGFGRSENMRKEFIKQAGLSPQAYRANLGREVSSP